MRILHWFFTSSSAEVRMYHISLDRPRPDDRDFDDEIVEAPRLQPRQRIHLCTALDLENTDCVGGTEVVIHHLIVHVELREVHGRAARVSYVQQAILDQCQHPESEQIDFHETHRIEI